MLNSLSSTLYKELGWELLTERRKKHKLFYEIIKFFDKHLSILEILLNPVCTFR